MKVEARNYMKYDMKEMTEIEKPREKLLKYGASHLADYELFAILLCTGTKTKSVLDVAIELSKYLSTISSLPDITYEELIHIDGIGKSKALIILSVIELGKRMMNPANTLTVVKNSMDAYLFLKNELQDKTQEYFVSIYLSLSNKVITHRIISIGSLTHTIASPKEVMKWGLKCSAYAVIIAHNHPSGNAEPSKQDMELTKQFIQASQVVDLVFVDHIIIGNHCYYSFHENRIIHEKTT